jgi:CheY-like chemotaxis protein
MERLDTAFVNDVLADALNSRYFQAALAAVDELGRRRDVGVLHTVDGQPSPLANALTHPVRSVRFAALRAIMSIDPTSPYPGSSRVPQALAWFASGRGERRALVAMPTNADATNLAGMLAAHGLTADATNRGRDAINLARQTADLEVILVDMNILLPEIRQVLYELRIHPETGDAPIAILAADGRLAAAQRLAGEHHRVVAVPRPHTAETLGRLVEDLDRVAPSNRVPVGQRAAQAVHALTWLGQLVAKNRAFYDLTTATPEFESALYHEGASKSAVLALARLGTPDSQRALLNHASESTLPAAARTEAAQAFRHNVAKFGVLLTTDEILSQYDRYNASAGADAATQHVLSHLLDTIESRRSAQGPTTPAYP